MVGHSAHSHYACVLRNTRQTTYQSLIIIYIMYNDLTAITITIIANSRKYAKNRVRVTHLIFYTHIESVYLSLETTRIPYFCPLNS